MSRKHIVIIWSAILVYIIYHIVTLIYSPLPWFDEVCFASITHTFMHQHIFFEADRSLSYSGLSLSYGPVYFMLQGFIAKLFGLGIFTFRFTNLFAGFADLYIIYKICRYLNFKISATIIALLIIALEPTFNQDLNSGRMDLVTLSFFLLSYLVFIKISSKREFKSIISFTLVGVLLACALLTTPRIIFAFAIYLVYFIYELFKSKKESIGYFLMKYAVILLSFLAIYMIWVYAEFGGVSGYIYFYTHSAVLMKHIGASTEVFKWDYHFFLLVYVVVALGYLIYYKGIKKNIELLLFTIPAIISFKLLVNGISDIYYALLMPFIAILIAGVTINLADGKLFRIINYCIVCAFGIVFVFKITVVFLCYHQRDPVYYNKAITDYIPKNVSVSGEFKYFYIAVNNNDVFQSTDWNGTVDEQIKYFKDNKVDYVVLNKYSFYKEIYEQKYLNQYYTLVAKIENKPLSPFSQKVLKYYPLALTTDYACSIYKRKNSNK